MQVLKRLGPKGLYQHYFSYFSSSSMKQGLRPSTAGGAELLSSSYVVGGAWVMAYLQSGLGCVSGVQECNFVNNSLLHCSPPVLGLHSSRVEWWLCVSSTFLCLVDSKVAFVSTEVALEWPEPLFCEVRHNGLLSLSGVWKGLFARIIMIGTLTALQWFIYDSVKVYFRLPRPPPPEMPESLKKKLGLTE